MTRNHRIAIALLAAALASISQSLHAEDWPQWMGPTRDNVWAEKGIVEKFPTDGPKKVWSSKIAGGYSGPAVVGNRVYATDFVSTSDVKVDNFGQSAFKGTERVLCYDAENGKELWRHEYPVVYTISYPAGPRCTPVVDEGHVYTLGAEGNLFCFAAETGKIVWERDLKKDYSTKVPLWGFSAHPLIDGPRIVCVVGGKGSQTVAFDKKTGKEIWKNIDAVEPGYSPPTIIEFNGRRQMILVNPQALNAVEPETGKLIWTTPYEANNGSIIMSPLLSGKFLFVGGFNNRNLMVELGSDGKSVTPLWQDKSKHAISPVNVQPIVDGDVIYGMDQRGDMVAFKVPSGERLWQTSKMLGERPEQSASAFIVRNADRYFLFTELGDLIIAKMSPQGYQEIDRAHIVEPTNNAFGRPVVWCAPAYANGRIYVRNDEELFCFNLSKN
jgi:outer membrane protein assembly factor BamB